jgi:hypothetical protein
MNYADFRMIRYITRELFCEAMRLKMWQTGLLFSTFNVRKLGTVDTGPGSAWTLEFLFDSYFRNEFFCVFGFFIFARGMQLTLTV